MTVKDEADSIQRLLDSLAAQTLQPDEVVVCDGGSTDGTVELLRAEKRLPLVASSPSPTRGCGSSLIGWKN